MQQDEARQLAKLLRPRMRISDPASMPSATAGWQRCSPQTGHMSAIGTGIPRYIIRLSRQLFGREPEFALLGEELRDRIWAKPPA